jgi:hypothetical protein
MTKKYLKKMPGTLRLSSDYLVICEHHSYSCCKECADKYPNILEVDEMHVWMENEEAAKEFKQWFETEIVEA